MRLQVRVNVLAALWLWFATLLGNPACLTPPALQVVPDAGPTRLGAYYLYGQVLQVEEGLNPALFRLVAVHEMSHHFWWVCDVKDRPLGRRFLNQSGNPIWDRRAHEEFAATLTWVVTGAGLPGGNVDRGAAHVFANRIVNPTPAIVDRLESHV